MNAYLHAKKSANKWGGNPEDYMPIHEWFDSSSVCHGDVRHRSLLHHTFGISLCVQVFGTTFKNAEGKTVITKEVAEQHVMDDIGRIPNPSDYINNMNLAAWMGGKKRKTKRITW